MKKIDSSILQKVKNKHFDYCKTLRPKNKKKILDEVCYKLCCENPFDFSNKDLDYFNSEYNDLLKDKEIDYRTQYEYFRRRTDSEWNGLELIKALGVTVCPYCGLNYFSTVDKENGKVISTATFDHYRSQKDFPMLAMNLYNLIPCCKNCNSTFKGNDNRTVCNPFFHSLEDEITFRINNADIVNQILSFQDDLNIEIDYDVLNPLLDNHNKVLSLKNRYKYFENIAKSVIYKRQIYNSGYIQQLENLGINITKKHIEDILIKQDVFGENEPFLKFKLDIWNQVSNFQH